LIWLNTGPPSEATKIRLTIITFTTQVQDSSKQVFCFYCETRFISKDKLHSSRVLPHTQWDYLKQGLVFTGENYDLAARHEIEFRVFNLTLRPAALALRFPAWLIVCRCRRSPPMAAIGRSRNPFGRDPRFSRSRCK